MTNLYIKVIDGIVTDHPLLSQCVKTLHSDFDGATIPTGIASYTQDVRPIGVPPFQTLSLTYEFNEDNNTVTGSWEITDKTEAEKLEVIAEYGELSEGEYVDENTGWLINELLHLEEEL